MYKLRPYNKYNDITEIEYSLKNYRNKMKKTASLDDIMKDVEVAVEIMNSKFDAGLSTEDIKSFSELVKNIMDSGQGESIISSIADKFKLKTYDELANPDEMLKAASLKKTASFIATIKQIVSEALSPIETVKNYFYMLKQLWPSNITKKIIALIGALIVTGLYTLSPVDLLPEAILGPIGLLDDVLSWFTLLPAAFKAILEGLIGQQDAGEEVAKIEQKEREKPGFFSSLFGGGEEKSSKKELILNPDDYDLDSEEKFSLNPSDYDLDSDEDIDLFYTEDDLFKDDVDDNFSDSFSELSDISRNMTSKSYLDKLKHLTKMANKFDLEGNYKKADEIDKLIKKYI